MNDPGEFTRREKSPSVISEVAAGVAAGDHRTAIQLIRYASVHFEHPHRDVHVAAQLISNCGWVDTDDGVVLIDTLLTVPAAAKVLEEIRRSGGRIRTIVYTHGHRDHVGGAGAFLEDRPEIIAHQYLPDRLEKYEILGPHYRRINAIQFHIKENPTRPKFVVPTRTYTDRLTFALGGKTFELHHARGETDDHTWVWVPEIRTAFVGDLLIGAFPNIGNPFKPTRFALPWARALAAVRAKQPEIIVAGGGRPVYQGDEARVVLDDTIAAIYSIHDQVVAHINRGTPLDEMIHAVRLPEELAAKPHLSFVYSRPEFAVFNIYRWYHGYFDHNPAHLLPRPVPEVAAEILSLVGDNARVLARSRELLAEGKPQLALDVLDILLQAQGKNPAARELRVEILKRLVADDRCTMSRNTYVYFIEQDEAFIDEESKGGNAR